MRLYFRPIAKMTLAVVPALLLLVGLGVWQIERLHWKLGLIAEVNRNIHAQPISLDEGTLIWETHTEYMRVALSGRFANDKEAYVFGTDSGGAPAYHVIVPFEMHDGRVFLVDRGIVPKEKLDPSTRRAGQLEGVRHIAGVWRTPNPPGAFTPPPDIAHRIWYAHDLAAIARADGIALAAPVIVEADAAPNPGGWPKGGQTVVEFRNEHLQYAITWFLMAAALLAVYLVYHRSAGRLGFR